MNQKLIERLNGVLPRLESHELLQNSGLGNEIGFYIFDYPPEAEWEVREYVRFILEQLAKRKSHLRVKHINLFELIVTHLRDRNLLDRGPVEAIHAQIRDALAQTEGRGMILAPCCVIPTTTPPDHLQAVRLAVDHSFKI